MLVTINLPFSGIVGADAEGRLPPDSRSQAENVFTTLEAILGEAATLDDVASLNSYHVGDLDSQLRELVDTNGNRYCALNVRATSAL